MSAEMISDKDHSNIKVPSTYKKPCTNYGYRQLLVRRWTI